MSKKLEIIVLAIILIFAIQFVYMSMTTDAEYTGADGQAEDAIMEVTGGTYEPIAEPFWEPPSSEIESLLFGLQAAIGAGILGYFFGYYRAKKRYESDLAYGEKSKSEGDSQSV
ncbi:MAG: energy-coupling factor ABC transporter substrate-binding protein [Methanosarcina thermophila]|jgi:cobalt/nickel transport protein|uniref:Cobalt transport protein CbiN n=3 Tax=Methanosarcina thermophila TaxID=2210 RepID=A0A1I6XUK1_METTE|nr:energy-coupling factor ABC transporter substrate-binding protein [Methanosarcina thermophila]ALK05724.1 MAG: cobalamin biosynthesis protein CbiN [Methanosarcina sp. 795]AKB12822.1 Additional substrate-specific component CbiN of cobalt ECF transporter [Methanosarcina thermophila TM-1]AKB16557.1 Additional substrate-specific component CbiN of cobalt ECF transporter [Methanosarcina thermophila CHTI-55]NLU56843.1 energy-coupling factor ABC transporter substrate-binding protein [Methanosarcina th